MLMMLSRYPSRNDWVPVSGSMRSSWPLQTRLRPLRGREAQWAAVTISVTSELLCTSVAPHLITGNKMSRQIPDSGGQGQAQEFGLCFMDSGLLLRTEDDSGLLDHSLSQRLFERQPRPRVQIPLCLFYLTLDFGLGTWTRACQLSKVLLQLSITEDATKPRKLSHPHLTSTNDLARALVDQTGMRQSTS